jgi:hypothetical protein
MQQVAVIEIRKIGYGDRRPARVAAVNHNAAQIVGRRHAGRTTQQKAIDEAEGDGVDAEAQRQNRDDAEGEARRARYAPSHRAQAHDQYVHRRSPVLRSRPGDLNVDQARTVLAARAESPVRHLACVAGREARDFELTDRF